MNINIHFVKLNAVHHSKIIIFSEFLKEITKFVTLERSLNGDNEEIEQVAKYELQLLKYSPDFNFYLIWKKNMHVLEESIDSWLIAIAGSKMRLCLTTFHV